jgi:hypothetical protein
VNDDWHKFVLEQKETDLEELITTEKLKSEETRNLSTILSVMERLKPQGQTLIKSCRLFLVLVVEIEMPKSRVSLKS